MLIVMSGIIGPLIPARVATVLAEQSCLTHGYRIGVAQVLDVRVDVQRVDGATEREVFFKVVIPSIRATIVTVVTTTVIAALKVFDIVKAMTGGNFRTSTIANDVYNSYFIQSREHYGSALAVVLFILVIPVVIVNQRNQARAREIA